MALKLLATEGNVVTVKANGTDVLVLLMYRWKTDIFEVQTGGNFMKMCR